MMLASSVVVTAVGQLVVGLIVTAFGAAIVRRAKKIELVVNSRLDAAIARIDQLETSIREGGGVPPKTTKKTG